MLILQNYCLSIRDKDTETKTESQDVMRVHSCLTNVLDSIISVVRV